jgi:hypothetical protein
LASKNPAPANFQRETAATTMFKERAVNRMLSIGTAMMAMAAR